MKALLKVFLLIIASNLYSLDCNIPGHDLFSIRYKGKTLYEGCYDSIHRTSHIVSWIYEGKSALENTNIRYEGNFRTDSDGGLLASKVKLPTHSDYTNSGFDRGHLAPNDDFDDNLEMSKLTFFMGNVAPSTLILIEMVYGEKQKYYIDPMLLNTDKLE